MTFRPRVPSVAAFVIFALALALILALALVAGPATAHEIRPAVVTVMIGDKVDVTIRLNVEAVIAGIGTEHKDTDDAPEAVAYKTLRALPADELARRFEAAKAALLKAPVLTLGGRAVALTLDRIDIPPVGDTTLARVSTLHLSGTPAAAPDALTWAQPSMFGNAIVRVQLRGQDLIEGGWLKAGETSKTLYLRGGATSTLRLMFDYAVVGFTHILPKGLDHILFVLGLYFLASSLKPLLIQVTAFTLAHSITLALGLYGVVDISPRIVEPLIAGSIIYVAVENMLTDKLTPWRPAIVFAFGLLHGLGFAGILREADLQPANYVSALIGFNVGVEFGQFAVIALAWIATGYWFRDKPWYRARVAMPASALIALCGLGWTIERLWLS